MITRFYKILYKGKEVVYVGITTRTIQARFREHIRTKMLNTTDYSIVEFDRIEHPCIDSIETYNNERLKVMQLEQKYIKDELDKGSNLLNLSVGGEWGSNIANKLRKAEFLNTYGSYNGYREYRIKQMVFYRWLEHWHRHRAMPKINTWLSSWCIGRTQSNTRQWLGNWVCCGQLKSKQWISHWVSHRTSPSIRGWLHCWATPRNHVKGWANHWVYHRTQTKSSIWFRAWVTVRSEHVMGLWLHNWVINRIE